MVGGPSPPTLRLFDRDVDRDVDIPVDIKQLAHERDWTKNERLANLPTKGARFRGRRRVPSLA